MRKFARSTVRPVLAITAFGLTLGYAEPTISRSDEELAAAALDVVLEHIVGGPRPLASHVRVEAYFVSRRRGRAPILCGWLSAHGVYPVTFASGGTRQTTATWEGLEFLFSARWAELCRPSQTLATTGAVPPRRVDISSVTAHASASTPSGE